MQGMYNLSIFDLVSFSAKITPFLCISYLITDPLNSSLLELCAKVFRCRYEPVTIMGTDRDEKQIGRLPYYRNMAEKGTTTLSRSFAHAISTMNHAMQ